nr:restriction endonuclease subunit S [Ectothiorhodospira lacustris]
MDAVNENGGIRLDQTRVKAEVGGGYTEFQDGDVVIAKITPCFENSKGSIATGLVNSAAYGTTELHVLRASQALDYRFLFYLTITDGYRKLGESEMYGAGGQKRVPPEFCKDFLTPLPPLPEQTAIADFLDREMGRIDRLVAKKRQLIALLKEQRTALISRTVTRGLPADAALEFGLEPHTRFKNSGIEWLGQVPEGWVVIPLRYAFLNQDYRRIPLAGIDRADMEKNYPYYGASGVIDYVEDYIFDEALILVAEDGANLLSRSTPLAFLATGKYWVNNHAHILKPLSGDIGYWVGVLQTFDYTPLITGAAQPKLTADRLGSIMLPKPSAAEQTAIATYLDRETAKIDKLMEKVEAAIARLQEYRTALITAAVTGKIDVREAVA